MCDYSLEHVASRPAKVGDKIITTSFPNSFTRGFCAVGEPHVAVCLLPGTELGFEQDVECERRFGFLGRRKLGQRVARFRRINENRPHMHHDALEFANGEIIPVTQLRDRQRATVLQLPADPRVRHVTEVHEAPAATIEALARQD